MTTRVRCEARGAITRLREASISLLEGAHRAVVETTTSAEHLARATTTFRDKSGATRASIRKGFRGAFRGFVRVRGVGHFLEYGTGLWGPHHARYPIVPVRAKMLRFVQHGAVRFASVVWHPGIRPRRFMQATRDTMATAFRHNVEMTVRDAVAAHNR